MPAHVAFRQVTRCMLLEALVAGAAYDVGLCVRYLAGLVVLALLRQLQSWHLDLQLYCTGRAACCCGPCFDPASASQLDGCYFD